MQTVNELVTGTYFCGPFTKTQNRPQGPFDSACEAHDQRYEHMVSKNPRGNVYLRYNSADAKLLDRLDKINYRELPKRQWLGFFAALKYFKTKRKFGERMEEKKYFTSTGREVIPYSNRLPSRRARSFGMPVVRYKRRKAFTRKAYGVRPLRRRKLRYRRKPRFRRKRRTRVRRRYGRKRGSRGAPVLTAKRLMQLIAPAVTVRGQQYQTVQLGANQSHFICQSLDSINLLHGSPGRFLRVFRAVDGNTTDTSRDNEAQQFWQYSKTAYRLHNPNNYPVFVRWYVLGVNRFSKTNSDIDSPLAAMDNSLDDTERYPGNVASVSSVMSHTLTQPLQPNAADGLAMWDGLAVPTWLYMKHFGSKFFTHFKIIQSGKMTIGPGAYLSKAIISRYGRVKGEMFDDVTEISRKARWMVYRIEAPYLNTTATGDTGIRETGHPIFEMSSRVETVDVGRQMISNSPKVVFIDDNASGANDPAFVGPSGTNFTISSTVGALNAATDFS